MKLSIPYIMKKRLFLISTLCFVMLSSVVAQNSISLVFTGVDQYNKYVRLDNVTIENLTREWSETIIFPDTIYTMNIGVGINEHSLDKEMQVMPNPFNGNTRVNIFASKEETVRMLLVDINGKKCAEYNGNLIAGDNLFDISLTTPQIYILQVSSDNGTRSLKMVNKGHAGSDRIMYAGNMKESAKIDLKSTSVHYFELGDEMRYTGYAEIQGEWLQSDIITQVQYISEDLTLRFEITPPPTPITVMTDTVILNGNEIHCYGTVQSGEGVTERGFCWGTNPHPSKMNDYILEGSGIGSFSSVLTGLNPRNVYYLRAFATNSGGTIYGNEFRFCMTNSYTQIDTAFIPDGVYCGNDCAYTSSININNFPDSATLQSADDIAYVRLKLEHSCIGDLYIALTCPNGQMVKILNKYAGSYGATDCSAAIPTPWGWQTTVGIYSGADFGVANTTSGSNQCDEATNPMGTPWNYCWSNNTNNGYVYANGSGYIYENVNMTGTGANAKVDSTNMANMTNVYRPDQPFSQLIGCPINGTWSISIIDGWASDNGWITEWELTFNGGTTITSVLPETFTPCPGVATVTDYDGNEYHTVQIGNQCWLKENLRTTHYISGGAISLSNVIDPSAAHYYVTEFPNNSGAYGYLYNWNAVVGSGSGSSTNPSEIQGICPSGWHVPSKAEWDQLTDYMSGLEGYLCGGNPSNIAKALASTDTSWNISSNPCAVGNDLSQNNISGFSALPAGYANGTSSEFGTYAKFWTATSYDNNNAHYYALNYDNDTVEWNPSGDKAYGMSVRCVRAEAPRVSTTAVIDILDSTAVGSGEVTFLGGVPVTERGLCWSRSTYPTIENDHLSCGTGLGVFSGQMTGLVPNTTYFMRAYATNAAGTVYGAQMSFTTFNKPTVSTYNVLNILDSTATCGGTVVSDGGSPVTARGICWSTSEGPTITDSHTIDSSGTGMFSSIMTGLSPNTNYYVRAYATNSVGTSYGAQKSFTTKTVPTVTLDSAIGISSTSAYCPINIISQGGVTITSWGVCYNTSPNPTLNDNVVAGPSIGNRAHLSGLTPGTTYYVRAFATNAIGTAYSNQISFTTLTIPSLANTSVYDISFYSATVDGEVLATGVSDIISRGICWSTSQIPTIADSHLADSIPAGDTGFGAFTIIMTGLNLNTQYYVRAYATNSSGIAYGDQVSFITLNTPTITTKTISYIQDSIATCGGIVTSDGGGALINKGICWSVSQNPTINDNITIDTSSQTDFTCVMTGLIPNTAYYVRAFATNGGGTAYGQQKVFVTSAVDGQPCINTATVMDYDSNTYNTVQIGLQCWMKENLRTTHYSNGEEIALGAGAVPSYPRLYYPGNNSSNVPTYGYLYNLAAVLHGSNGSASNPSGVQGICPDGWHVPSDAEWTQLTEYVSSQSQYLCHDNTNNIAKALSDSLVWINSNNSCAVGNNPSTNNTTGFSVLPAGANNSGSAYYFGNRAYFWSATPNTTSGTSGSDAYSQNIQYNNTNILRGSSINYAGYSVRCVRD